MEPTTLLTTVGDKLSARFGKDLISSELLYDYPTFVVSREALYAVLEFLKTEPGLEFGYLTTLCGLHYPEQEKPFGLMYQLHNLPNNLRIRLKTFMRENEMQIPSATPLWPAANWMEREAYDFYGFRFSGHPNLKRILNVEDMDYFPLRKNYALEDPTREDKDDTMFGR